MAHDRRFRFGVQLNQPLGDRTWAQTAQFVEQLGYSTLVVPDHLHDQLAPIAALTAAAAATETLRVGTLVLTNDFRHPVTLANEMATLDLLSSGRAEIGLGAGWMQNDFDTAGIPFDALDVRVRRLDEAARILKSAFSGTTFDFDGEFYTIRHCTGRPAPAQPGGPPLMIDGGERDVMGVAARHADIVGLNPVPKPGVALTEAVSDVTASAIDERIGWLRTAAGDRFADLEICALAFLADLTDNVAERTHGLPEHFGVAPNDLLDAPAAVLGSVEQIANTLAFRRERWGVSYYVFQGEAAVRMAPVVERLAGT
ncbi:MAG: TIGR03621 family F420-dependent LLM class oxidoreductase [Actinomycetes bacterium]